MSTGQNIIDEIRYDLQDYTAESFGDTALLKRINTGATEFCARTLCLQDTGNINTNATNYTFTLASSLTNPIFVLSVRFNGTPLTRTYFHEVTYKFGASSATPDQTTAWYEFAGVLYISVIPPTATGASALNISYARIPTDLSTVNSTFDFPDEWKSAIIAYTIGKCLKSTRDSVLAAGEMTKFEAMVQTAWQINSAKLMGI